jgi:uncharacterized protein (DUF3084 family)
VIRNEPCAGWVGSADLFFGPPTAADLRARTAGNYDRAVFPDDRWNERDRYLAERERKLDARERLLEAREQRLSGLQESLNARRTAAEHRERLVAEREVAAEERGRRADERDAIADGREVNASDRERLLDERDQHTGDDETPRPDPLERIQGAFTREIARLDRSDAFLERSRDAVQRAQSRLDALRAGQQAPHGTSQEDDQGTPPPRE